MAWLIASEHDGELPDSHEIAWRLRVASIEVEEDAKTLIALGFMEYVDESLAGRKHDASKMLRQSRVEKSRDRDGASEFEPFWKAYPKREGSNPKAAALKAWNARVSEGIEPSTLIASVEKYRAFLESGHQINTRFVMQASSFLGPEKRGWEEDWAINPNGAKPDRADVEQLVADVLYLVEQGGTILDIPDEREHALEDLSRKHPVQWGRAGPWMENLKLGRIRGEGGRDREHEIRTQIRQLNGVVHG